MNRSDLVEKKADEWDVSKSEARVIVDKFFDSIGALLEKHGRIELRGFGVFELQEREPTKGRIPGTGEEVEVPARKVPTFTAGKYLKEAVNAD
ncbi:MAG: HU family DNA-binding protein [bacterium]